MTADLQSRAAKVRAAVQEGDFVAGRNALEEFTLVLRQAVGQAEDQAARAELEREWNELVIWIRSMAATSHALARDQWELLQAAKGYRPARPASDPSIVDARG